MNLLEKFLIKLQVEMNTPTAYGWFHLLWVSLSLLMIIILFLRRNKHNEKTLKIVLGTYGIITLVLELLKQLMWSVNLDITSNIVTWDYNWYAAPFQLCTTPMYVAIICLFLKKNKIRDALLSYVAFYTILGSIMTMLIPDSCFTKDILINIHTMYLHCGSFVVSAYLLISKEIKINIYNLLSGFIIFLIFVFIANGMNIIFYKSGIIGTETFNMFYISPYFISVLPVYDKVQENLPYIVYLLFYMTTFYLGGAIVYLVSYILSNLKRVNQR